MELIKFNYHLKLSRASYLLLAACLMVTILVTLQTSNSKTKGEAEGTFFLIGEAGLAAIATVNAAVGPQLAALGLTGPLNVIEEFFRFITRYSLGGILLSTIQPELEVFIEFVGDGTGLADNLPELTERITQLAARIARLPTNALSGTFNLAFGR